MEALGRKGEEKGLGVAFLPVWMHFLWEGERNWGILMVTVALQAPFFSSFNWICSEWIQTLWIFYISQFIKKSTTYYWTLIIFLLHTQIAYALSFLSFTPQPKRGILTSLTLSLNLFFIKHPYRKGDKYCLSLQLPNIILTCLSQRKKTVSVIWIKPGKSFF